MMKKEIIKFMQSEPVLAEFVRILGSGANSYIASVLVTVSNDERLQDCTPQSIFVAAMKAALCRLPVDNTLGRAYLVAYKNGALSHEAGHDVYEAQFQPSYKGLKQMGMDTGKYRWINSVPIFEGVTAKINQMTGLFEGFEGSPISGKVVSWLAGFELVDGFAAYLQMTVDEIHEHAKKYNPGGYTSNKGGWKKYQRGHKDNIMERKTPLRLLLMRDGYLDPTAAAVLRSEDSDDVEVIDIPADLDEAERQTVKEVKRTEQENLEQLGFE